MTTLVSVKNVVKRYTRGKQKVEVLHGSIWTSRRASSSRSWARPARARPHC